MPEISPALYRAGDGEPLVLVHGFTATWACWRPVIADLVPHFEVIAPTLHGHDGGPPPPDGPAHTIVHAADHFERLLDELGVGEAHFAGNSMGGAISLEMAKRGRARSVVAISPGGGWERHDTAEGERIIKWFALNRRMSIQFAELTPKLMRRPNVRRFLLRDVMTRGEQVSVREAIQLAESSANCSVVEDVFETIRSGSALLEDLDRISCPVLVAWGTNDRILPMDRHAARFKREIPGVRFVELPGLGHTPMWDDPVGIAGMIANWAGAAARATAPAAAVA
jgi:pimeloyl-ACP methyl ester carboxylesterase